MKGHLADVIKHAKFYFKQLLGYVLCSPATSAPVERVFSQSGFLMRPNRARMSNALLETLVFLKCNISHL